MGAYKTNKGEKYYWTIYTLSLFPRRISQSRVPQVPHSQESDREMPLNVIDWAVRQPAPARRPVPMPHQSLVSSSPAGSEASSSLSTRITFEDRVLDPVLVPGRTENVQSFMWSKLS